MSPEEVKRAGGTSWQRGKWPMNPYVLIGGLLVAGGLGYYAFYADKDSRGRRPGDSTDSHRK